MSNPIFLRRSGREEFSTLLGTLYDAGRGLVLVKDPSRFGLTAWDGVTANADVADNSDEILTQPSLPKFSARVASVAIAANFFQNELTLRCAKTMPDPTTCHLTEDRFLVNNPAFFTDERFPNYPDEEQAVVQTSVSIAEVPQGQQNIPLTPEAFATFMQEHPDEISFLRSEAMREIDSLTLPACAVRPMTTADLDRVRMVIGEIVPIGHH